MPCQLIGTKFLDGSMIYEDILRWGMSKRVRTHLHKTVPRGKAAVVQGAINSPPTVVVNLAIILRSMRSPSSGLLVRASYKDSARRAA